jgi:phospholipase C
MAAKARSVPVEERIQDLCYGLKRYVARSTQNRSSLSPLEEKMNDAAPAIKNVFVLMLENHSFDNIFAMSGIPGIRAATTQASNWYCGKEYFVKNRAPLVYDD